MRTVTEDFFGMGDAWKTHKQPAGKRPVFQTQFSADNPNTPEASIPVTKGKTQNTVHELLEDMVNKRTDAPSLGDLYHRPHDGDTARTSRNQGNDDASLSSHESDKEQTDITIAGIPATIRPTDETKGGDTSTAKSSVHYRLQRDKSREMAAKSQEESRQLLEALRLEREELAKAREELDRLRISKSNTQVVTPSVNRGQAGTETDSAGDCG